MTPESLTLIQDLCFSQKIHFCKKKKINFLCVDVLENIFYSQISTCLCIVFVHVSFFMVNMGDAMHAVIHFVCFV